MLDKNARFFGDYTLEIIQNSIHRETKKEIIQRRTT